MDYSKIRAAYKLKKQQLKLKQSFVMILLLQKLSFKAIAMVNYEDSQRGQCDCL